MEVTTFEFEDNGQDFLEWDVEMLGAGLGRVIDSRPFKQAWVGNYILNPDAETGDHLYYSGSPEHPVYQLKYQIISVTEAA